MVGDKDIFPDEVNQMNLKVKSLFKNEGFIRTSVVSFLTNMNPTLSWMNEIKTAVSEAVTNSIVHGYDGDSNHLVEINAQTNEKEVIIEIIDTGKGMSCIKEEKSNFFQERAGMGFEIMKSFVDDVSVESEINKGTKVTLKKKIERR